MDAPEPASRAPVPSLQIGCRCLLGMAAAAPCACWQCWVTLEPVPSTQASQPIEVGGTDAENGGGWRPVRGCGRGGLRAEGCESGCPAARSASTCTVAAARLSPSASTSRRRRGTEARMGKLLKAAELIGRAFALVLVSTIVAACGSSGSASGNVDASESSSDDSGSQGIADGSSMGEDAEGALDAASSDAPTDARPGPGDAGSFACGDATCAPGQLCVHPCCGGAAPSCLMPLPEAGTCPNNLVKVSDCPGTGGPGCMPPPCTPPAPFCLDANQCPNACGCAPVSCGACPPASGRDVMCLCG